VELETNGWVVGYPKTQPREFTWLSIATNTEPVGVPAYHNSTLTNQLRLFACKTWRLDCGTADEAPSVAPNARQDLQLRRNLTAGFANCGETRRDWKTGRNDRNDRLSSTHCFIKRRANHPVELHAVLGKTINLSFHTHHATVTALGVVPSPCEPSGLRSIFTIHTVLDRTFDSILICEGRSEGHLDLPSAWW